MQELIEDLKTLISSHWKVILLITILTSLKHTTNLQQLQQPCG
jgi:hypothetical protein